jgi:hypothetical protein
LLADSKQAMIGYAMNSPQESADGSIVVDDDRPRSAFIKSSQFWDMVKYKDLGLTKQFSIICANPFVMWDDNDMR